MYLYLVVCAILGLLAWNHSSNLNDLSRDFGWIPNPKSKRLLITAKEIHIPYYTPSRTIYYAGLVCIYIGAIRYVGYKLSIDDWIVDITCGLALLDGLRASMYIKVSCWDIVSHTDLTEVGIVDTDKNLVSKMYFSKLKFNQPRTIDAVAVNQGDLVKTKIFINPVSIKLRNFKS